VPDITPIGASSFSSEPYTLEVEASQLGGIGMLLDIFEMGSTCILPAYRKLFGGTEEGGGEF
jgi:hypothetical protein